MVDIKVLREARGLVNSSYPRIAGSENNSKSIPSFIGDDFNGYDKLVSAFDNEFQKGDGCKDSTLIEALKQMLDKHEKATKNIKSAIKLIESNGKKK